MRPLAVLLLGLTLASAQVTSTVAPLGGEGGGGVRKMAQVTAATVAPLGGEGGVRRLEQVTSSSTVAPLGGEGGGGVRKVQQINNTFTVRKLLQAVSANNGDNGGNV